MDRLPLVLKLSYSLFVAILIPVYWRRYGLSNFLWFSDLALLITAAALWLESPVLASMQALSVLVLELGWLVDFLVRLLTGVELVGLTRYMFNRDIPLLIRVLSLFHVGLPFLLVWLVDRLGYDRHALLAQTMLAWVVLPVCFFVAEPSNNINWVFGPGEKPHKMMPPVLYLVLMMVFLPVCIYLPTHFVLKEFLTNG